MKLAESEPIGSAASPNCALCGNRGDLLYAGISDRLFEAWGQWNLKRCVNPDCRLMWPDPMPLAQEIGKAYAKYYTHVPQVDTVKMGVAKRMFLQMKRSYWARKYGYQTMPDNFRTRAMGALMYLIPLRRREADAGIRFLDAKPQGRLLDVGCGSGEWLALMRELGWQVEGLDFDQNAVEVANRNGLKVRCGGLEEQKYPDGSFDAVTLNHVIEHVPDPLQTVTECLRVLKPGGKLVVFTPNNSSLSHQWFKGDWRGLEPPRHLHIFSMNSMLGMLAKAGFRKITIRPHIAASVIYESILLRRGTFKQFPPTRVNRSAWYIARGFNILELGLISFKPAVADCLAAIAEKE